MKPKTWTHPKFALLKRTLNVPTATAAGILEGIWHLTASFHEETGEVPYDGDALVAWLELEMSGVTLITALVSAAWLEERDGSLFVHDWHDHKPNYVVERIRKRKYRDARDNAGMSQDGPRTRTGQSAKGRVVAQSATPSASASASVGNGKYKDEGKYCTPTGVPSSNNTIKEQSSGGGTGKRKTKYEYSEDFKRWYAIYPRHEGIRKAAAAFKVAIKSIDLDALCEITKVFADSDKGRGDFCPLPATWLSQARWQDDQSCWVDGKERKQRVATQKDLDEWTG